MRMSKPFAAKGIGACLKHVLNTRLGPAPLRHRRVEQYGALEREDDFEHGSFRIRSRFLMRLATSSTDNFLREFLKEGDPLPPDDRAPAARPSALDLLYRAHSSRLLRFFARQLGKDDALDLVHETFARFAGRGNAGFDPVAKPEAYLSTVATNLLRDRARAAARRALNHHRLLDEGGASASDPHKLLEDREALARLEVAIARLSSRRRKIFLLHRLEQLTYDEIAGEVGMSVKGVKKQMAKALFELRRDVGPL